MFCSKIHRDNLLSAIREGRREDPEAEVEPAIDLEERKQQELQAGKIAL